jgi:hypothetical protein
VVLAVVAIIVANITTFAEVNVISDESIVVAVIITNNHQQQQYSSITQAIKRNSSSYNIVT